MRKIAELLFLVLLLAGLAAVSRNLENYVSSNRVKEAEKTAEKTVVIDSGHGGSDPGKIGINGAEEKELNLKIAVKVKELLEEEDIQVVMTREDDTSLAKDTDTNQKVQDMKARVELINRTAPDLTVSIHQNSYQEEGIHGAQVFYYTHSEEGKRIAEIMQKALLTVDPQNHRQAKADSTYYLLKRTEVPTIIVECGFLSNREEADKLITETYQRRMAEAIVDGIKTCLME